MRCPEPAGSDWGLSPQVLHNAARRACDQLLNAKSQSAFMDPSPMTLLFRAARVLRVGSSALTAVLACGATTTRAFGAEPVPYPVEITAPGQAAPAKSPLEGSPPQTTAPAQEP